MTHLTDMSATHALDRLAAWQTALRAENKSPGTVAVYTDGTIRYLRWCAEHDHLPMGRTFLNRMDRGHARCRSRSRYRAHPATGRTPLRELAHRRG